MANHASTLPLVKGLVEPSSVAPPPGHCVRVTIVLGPDAGQSVVAGSTGKSVVVGRAASADVRLSDPAVSQFHAELSAVPGSISVRDLESRNGVWHAAARLGRAVVPTGALLTLGGSTLRVESVPAQEARPKPVHRFGHLVGESASMRELFPLLARLAETEISVLIEGDTGTGKGEVAQALYDCSARAGKPFVVLDCTLLPENLAPSLLFGHERGAFTGAVDRRIGAFESAHGGVLFMDEVGELSPSVQAMLLRAVQYREITPVGSTKKRSVDIRIVSATWRDLRSLVNEGAFREDLYYRLAGATVRLPTLAQRVEDIPLLVESLLGGLPADSRAARAIAPDALQALRQRHFPGNVRQLHFLVERLARLAAGPTITLADLEMEHVLSGLRDRTEAPRQPHAAAPRPEANNLLLYQEAKQSAMEEFERGYLQQLLDRAEGNLSRAAALAGIQRHNLRALLRKHGLYRGDSDPA